MPVTAKSSRDFYDRFGDKAVDELVGLSNDVDGAFKADSGLQPATVPCQRRTRLRQELMSRSNASSSRSSSVATATAADATPCGPTPMGAIPARRAASIPAAASSTTTHRQAGVSSRRAASRNTSGMGLPARTSSAATSAPKYRIHLVVDNYSTHKHAKVTRWLAARPRYQLHFTPTYASWLNQVEIWFNIITQKAIRRGSFRSVKELVTRIATFEQHYNPSAHPFVWTATADSILQKLERLCEAISGTRY